MTDKSLYIIGTNHSDLKGEKRLTDALGYLNPKIIALEMSKDRAIQLNNSHLKTKLKGKLQETISNCGLELTNTEINKLIKLNSLVINPIGYELKVAKQFSKQNTNTKLEYIDISIYSQGYESFEKGLLGTVEHAFFEIAKNPKAKEKIIEITKQTNKQFKDEYQDQVDIMYNGKEDLTKIYKELVKSQKENPEVDLSSLIEMVNPKRDKHMAKAIKKLYSDMPSGNLCSIVGLIHIPGIAERIKDLNPITLTLPEAAIK